MKLCSSQEKRPESKIASGPKSYFLLRSKKTTPIAVKETEPSMLTNTSALKDNSLNSSRSRKNRIVVNFTVLLLIVERPFGGTSPIWPLIYRPYNTMKFAVVRAVNGISSVNSNKLIRGRYLNARRRKAFVFTRTLKALSAGKIKEKRPESKIASGPKSYFLLRSKKTTPIAVKETEPSMLTNTSALKDNSFNSSRSRKSRIVVKCTTPLLYVERPFGDSGPIRSLVYRPYDIMEFAVVRAVNGISSVNSNKLIRGRYLNARRRKAFVFTRTLKALSAGKIKEKRPESKIASGPKSYFLLRSKKTTPIAVKETEPSMLTNTSALKDNSLNSSRSRKNRITFECTVSLLNVRRPFGESSPIRSLVYRPYDIMEFATVRAVNGISSVNSNKLINVFSKFCFSCSYRVLTGRPEGLPALKINATRCYDSHRIAMDSIAQNASIETQTLTRNLRSFPVLCDNTSTEKNDGFLSFIVRTPSFDNGSAATGPLSFALLESKQRTAFQLRKLIRNIPGKIKTVSEWSLESLSGEILTGRPEGLPALKINATRCYDSHRIAMDSIAQNASIETQTFTRNLRSFPLLCDNTSTEKNDGLLPFIVNAPSFDNGSAATGPLSFALVESKQRTAFQLRKLIRNIPGKIKTVSEWSLKSLSGEILTGRPEGLPALKINATRCYDSHRIAMDSIAQNASIETQTLTRNLRSFPPLCDNTSTEKNDVFLRFIVRTPSFDNGSGATGPLSFAPLKIKRSTVFHYPHQLSLILQNPRREKNNLVFCVRLKNRNFNTRNPLIHHQNSDQSPEVLCLI